MTLLCSPPRGPRDRRLLQSGAGPPVLGLRRGHLGLSGQLGRCPLLLSVSFSSAATQDTVQLQEGDVRAEQEHDGG